MTEAPQTQQQQDDRTAAPDLDDAILDCGGAALFFAVSASTFRRMRRADATFPAPIFYGPSSRPRWPRGVLRQWRRQRAGGDNNA